MASIEIVHRWSDEEATIVTVEIENDYPDALAEAKATSVAVFRDAIGHIRDTFPVED